MKIGRPLFKVTPRLKTQVERRIAAGWKQSDIAAEIGISIPTLALHFEAELSHGHAKRRGEALDLLWKSARAGNVSAQKALVALQMTGDPAAPVEAKPSPERSIKLGKKEIAKQQAESAGEGTEWGSDLDPSSGLN